MQPYKTVAEFMADLPEPRRSEVEAIRKIIMEAEPELREHIKWNAPSYFLAADDRITFNARSPSQVRLVLHAGATRKEDKAGKPIFDDSTGLLEWNSDIRATLPFAGMADIESKQEDVKSIIRTWLRIFG